MKLSELKTRISGKLIFYISDTRLFYSPDADATLRVSTIHDLIAAVEAAQAVNATAEASMYGNETDDPACCDPYIVERQAFRKLRAALAKFEEE